MTKYTITWVIPGSTDVEAESADEARFKLAQISNAMLVIGNDEREELTCTTEADRAADVRDELHWNDPEWADKVIGRFMAMTTKEFGESTSFEGVEPAKDAGQRGTGRG